MYPKRISSIHLHWHKLTIISYHIKTFLIHENGKREAKREQRHGPWHLPPPKTQTQPKPDLIHSTPKSPNPPTKTPLPLKKCQQPKTPNPSTGATPTSTTRTSRSTAAASSSSSSSSPSSSSSLSSSSTSAGPSTGPARPQPRPTRQPHWASTRESSTTCLWFYTSSRAMKRPAERAPTRIRFAVRFVWACSLRGRRWRCCRGVGIVSTLSVSISGWRRGRAAPCVELRSKVMVEVEVEFEAWRVFFLWHTSKFMIMFVGFCEKHQS